MQDSLTEELLFKQRLKLEVLNWFQDRFYNEHQGVTQHTFWFLVFGL